MAQDGHARWNGERVERIAGDALELYVTKAAGFEVRTLGSGAQQEGRIDLGAYPHSFMRKMAGVSNAKYIRSATREGRRR